MVHAVPCIVTQIKGKYVFTHPHLLWFICYRQCIVTRSYYPHHEIILQLSVTKKFRSNGELFSYSETVDYSGCEFNCTYKGTFIEHKSYEGFECKRANGKEGVQYVDCVNGEATTKSPCLLKSCPVRNHELSEILKVL